MEQNKQQYVRKAYICLYSVRWLTSNLPVTLSSQRELYIYKAVRTLRSNWQTLHWDILTVTVCLLYKDKPHHHCGPLTSMFTSDKGVSRSWLCKTFPASNLWTIMWSFFSPSGFFSDLGGIQGECSWHHQCTNERCESSAYYVTSKFFKKSFPLGHFEHSGFYIWERWLKYISV